MMPAPDKSSKGVEKMKKIIVLLAMAVLLPAASASATIIDFQAVSFYDDADHGIGPVYAEDGFNLYTPGGKGFATDGLLCPFHLGGTAYLYSDTSANNFITMTKTDGSTFSANSIDLAELMGFGDVTVTFSGVRSNNAIVNQAFTLDGDLGFETFLFSSDFTDLVSLSWDNQADFNAFDNIVVDVPATAPVPVPGAVWLLGAGLSGLLGLRRRVA